MWIIVKLTAVIIAFLIRFYKRNIRMPADSKNPQEAFAPNLMATVTTKKSKSGVISKTVFSVPFNCNAIFKFTEEARIDQIFKSLGLADELQTNDHNFDSKIYIASDSFNLKQEIRNDPLSRQWILELFKDKCTSITCDGENLEFSYDSDQSNQPELNKKMAACYQQMSEMKNPKTWLFADSFARTILVIESIIWSLGIYAASTFYEWMYSSHDVHLDKSMLIKQGLFCGIGIAVGLLALIVFFLKGSSRGHRILVESFLVLMVSMPIGGIAMISDINTNSDTSASVIVVAKLNRVYEVKHRRRKGGTSYSYHIEMSPQNQPADIKVPTHLTISRFSYTELKSAKAVKLEIGRGRLKLPWIRSIEASSEDWD